MHSPGSRGRSFTSTAAPPAGTLRMCHKKHLIFGQNDIQFHIDTITKKNGGGVEDEYFVDDEDVRKWGGPVYRVDFPDHTTRDVMACTVRRCTKCSGKGKDHVNKTGVPPDAKSFMHRREFILAPGRSFAPDGGPYVYSCQPNGSPASEDMPIFPRGGPGGTSPIVAPSLICGEGYCKPCDAGDSEGKQGEVNQEMRDEQEKDKEGDKEEDDLHGLSPPRTRQGTRRRVKAGKAT